MTSVSQARQPASWNILVIAGNTCRNEIADILRSKPQYSQSLSFSVGISEITSANGIDFIVIGPDQPDDKSVEEVLGKKIPGARIIHLLNSSEQARVSVYPNEPIRVPLEKSELLSAMDKLCRDYRKQSENLYEKDSEGDYNDLLDMEKRLDRLLESTNGLASCSFKNELGPTILREFSKNMAAEGGSLFLVEKNGIRLLHTLDSMHVPEFIEFPLDEHSVFGRALREKKPVLLRNIKKQTDTVSSGWNGYKDNSTLVFPIKKNGDRVIALLSLHNKTVPPFTPQDKKIGMILASYTCEAIKSIEAWESYKEKEERYNLIFQSIQEVFHEVTIDGIIIDLSPSISKMSGYTREELIGTSMDKLYAFPETREEYIKAIMKEGKVNNFEIILKDKDGSHVICSITSKLQYNADGQPDRMIGTLRDVSEKKQTEELLQMAQFSIERAADCVFWILPDSRIVYVNEAACRTLEYSKEELLNMSICDIDKVIDRRMWVEFWPEFREEGSVSVESIQITKNGREIPVEVRGNFIEYKGKEYDFAFVRDISEQKKTEEERLHLAAAIEQAVEIVFITDAEGIIQYINPAFEKVTGYSREEAVGQNPRIIKSGKQDSKYYDDIWKTISSGKVWKGRIVNRKKNGDLWEEDMAITPIRDQTEHIVKYVAVGRDVTKEAQMEVLLRQAQKMEAIGQMAGGVSHDFNNILQVIQGHAQIAQLAMKPEEQSMEDLDQIIKAAERASTLTRQLLAFSRRQVLQKKDLDLDRVISDLIKMIRRLIGENIELEIVSGRELKTIHADPGQVEQIIVNLCVNARDAMSDGGKITIETENYSVTSDFVEDNPWAREGNYVLLTIADTGAGMTPEVKERIFEPFFTTKDTGYGTGLGLATVYGIVKQHGGFINVESVLDDGTVFQVYFPAVERPVSSEADQKMEKIIGGTETILLAEDDDLVRSLAIKTLQRAGYNTIMASDGEDAVRKFEDNIENIDLVLLDVIMPKMSGHGVYERIIKLKPDVKVLFSTGYSTTVIDVGYINSKGLQILHKPYNSLSLLSKVREMLDLQDDE